MSKLLILPLFFLVVLAAGGASGQEFKPYVQPQVTPAQWQAYFDEVKARHSASMRDSGKQLLIFQDDASRTSYVFTQAGHPAHPAWVARRLQQAGDDVSVRQVGFYAGALEPFAELFQDILRIAERARDELNGKPGRSLL